MNEKKRSRKKQLFYDIVKQVEFYFSSANLSKDRYMTQVLSENENGVELTLLLTFNKLKSLTTDIKILKKALNLSKCLELTENETRVKSKIPYVPKENIDDCTIYVERLPLDASLEFIKQIFSQYGEVDYISMPKFHNTGKIKGFAFVEYSNPSNAQKAIEEFKRNGNYLPIDMAPGNLRSICTFDKKMKEKLLTSHSTDFEYDEHISRNDEDEYAYSMAEEIENVDLEPMKLDEATESDEMDKKRKHSPSMFENKNKKVKSDTEETDIKDDLESLNKLNQNNSDTPMDTIPRDQPPDSTSETKVDDQKLEPDNGEMEEILEKVDEELGDDVNQRSKKKRRHKKKERKERLPFNSGLLILSKADWKRMRNRYLNLQWEKMRSLKNHLYRCKKHTESQSDKSSSNSSHTSTDIIVDIPNTVVKVTLSEPVIEVKEFKSLVKSRGDGVTNIDVKEGSTEVYVRFFNAESAKNFTVCDNWKCCIISGDEEKQYWAKIIQDRKNKFNKKNKKMEGTVQGNGSTGNSSSTLTIAPGTIVKVQTSEPITNIAQLKIDLKRLYKTIQYIDVQEGDREIYVRLNSAENAVTFSTHNSYGDSQILTGEEEKSYWKKINEDRTVKFTKHFRSNKRGKDKLIKKAENMFGKHILFDDIMEDS